MRASETCSRWFLWVATIAALLSSTACRSAAPTSTLGGAADNPDFGMVGGASGVRRQEPVVESVSGAESLATDEDLAAAGDDAAYALHGYLNVGLRGRTGGGDSDADLFTFLSLDGGDAERNAATFHVSARASKDLGGGQDSDDVFFDVSDTYDSGFDARLYSAHVDVHSIEEFSILRIGRQQDIETPVPAYYDGVHVRSEEMAEGKMHFGGYGGLSTHLYESTDSDDRVFGAYLGGRPWRDGRWRFDWMRAKDHRRTDGDESDLEPPG